MMKAFLLLLTLGLATEGHANIVCPNRDPGPDFKDCGEDGCGPAADGGDDHEKSAAGPGNGAGGGNGDGGGDSCMYGGDPIDLGKGFVNRSENDFRIGVKHGAELSVGRFYSSIPNFASGFGISQSNSAGQGMFGQNWYCSHEQHLEIEVDPEWGFLVGLVLVDENAANRHFELTSTNTWRSRLDQGSPLELTITGTGTGTIYSIRAGDNSVRKFRADGRIVEQIPDNFQPSISTTYEYYPVGYPTGGSWSWDNNLWKIHAPSGDGRFIEFQYHTHSWNRKVYNVWLKTSTSAYRVSSYWYNANGYLEVAKGQGPGQTHWLLYEYGSFNPASTLTNPTAPLTASTAGPILGRVSYYADNDPNPRPLVAYTYGPAFSNSVSREWRWDLSGTTPQWRQTLATNADPWNHALTLYLGDGVPDVSGGPNDPASHYATDYQCDLTQLSYSGITAKMPPTNRARPGEGAPGGPTSGYEKHRLQGSGLRLDGSQWHKEWENIYNLTTTTGYNLSDPEYLAQHRLNESRKFWGAGTYASTVYTYHSNTVAFGFWYKPTRVTNPTGEYVDYEYYAVGTPDQSRLKATIRGGLRTEYTYNAAGHLWKVKDVQLNTETVYAYDTRGNVTQITDPTGQNTTRTYNDFGQVLTETVTNQGTSTSTYSDSLPTTHAEYCLPPRLIETANASGQITHYFYNSQGDTTKVVDANNRETLMYYNTRGLRTQVKNTNSESVFYGYDLFDRMNKFTDGRGKITTYEHDVFGRVTKETDPDGYFTTYAYSDNSTGSGCGSCSGGGASLASRVVRQDNTAVSFTYDWAGRLTLVNYESIGAVGSNEISYAYDPASRITSITDTRLTLGATAYSFLYDIGSGKTGRLDRLTHPNGWTQEYFYEESTASPHYRRLKAYRDIDGNITQHTYDNLGRQATLTDPYNKVTSYTYATPADLAFPVGSMKQIIHGNDSKALYTYDSLGRTDRIDYAQPSSAVFDYIDLAYDPVGMITERKRKDGASWYKTVYTYDNAYRLSGETNRTSADVYQTSRTYGYDSAGNRSWMTLQNSASVNKTTNYTYGNRNQLASNTGYFRDGTTDTGAMSYTWDVKGNMLTRTGQSYTWNEDNRLTQVTTGANTKSHKYDSAGRRILSQTSASSERTRHFFNGLTEETRKVSLGTHSDSSFTRWLFEDGVSTNGWGQGVGTGGTVSAIYDSARFSNIIRFQNGGRFDMSIHPSRTEQAFAFWFKHETSTHSVVLWVTTSAGARRIVFKSGTGTDGYASSEYNVWLGTGILDGNWHRIERNLAHIVSTQTPGVTFTSTNSVSVWSSGCRLDDMHFSNNVTVEQNVLGTGVVGHILRNRSINKLTGATADRWFHYDQVGSVISESDASGLLAQTHHQDAFGNTQAAWNTGLWGGDKPGWHHNTKEYDGDTGLVYMYQRWYSAETGTFMSSAPFPVMMEHRYGFAENAPTVSHDHSGRIPLRTPSYILGLDWDDGLLAAMCTTTASKFYPHVSEPGMEAENDKNNSLRHCYWMCCLTKNIGGEHAKNIGDLYEIDEPNPGIGSQVDQYNNGVGRGLGCNKDGSCFEDCEKAYKDGALQDEKGNPTNRF
jgi:RHS repeat-associated protein